LIASINTSGINLHCIAFASPLAVNSDPKPKTFLMKKLVFVFMAMAMIASTTCDAQYRVNKMQYDYQQYVPEVGDPYNPGVAGVCSFLIPGLGQMISNEGGRGAGFLGGYIGCWVVYGVGYGSVLYDGSGAGVMLLGAAGALGVNIWAIVDAVRVAKVNNMAWRDRSQTSLQLLPKIGMSPDGQPIPAMTVALRF
jgi:hypothetical protein